MFRVSKNRIRYSALSFIKTSKYRKKAVTPSFNLQKINTVSVAVVVGKVVCNRLQKHWLLWILCDGSRVQTAESLYTRAFQFGQKKFRFDSIRQSDKFAAFTLIFK